VSEQHERGGRGEGEERELLPSELGLQRLHVEGAKLHQFCFVAQIHWQGIKCVSVLLTRIKSLAIIPAVISVFVYMASFGSTMGSTSAPTSET